jgi:hypothetical protein
MHASPHAHPLVEAAPLPVPAETEPGAIVRAVRNTPWWSISAALHVLVVLIVGFFWVVRTTIEDVAPLVSMPRRKVEPPRMDPPKDLPVAEKLIPVEAKVPDEAILKDPDDRPISIDERELLQPQKKGDDTSFIADKPFKSASVNDAIGGGPAAGGNYGHRLGGLGNGRGRINGSMKAYDDAVLAALRWLARHQNSDGSWSVTGYIGQCKQTCSPNPGMEEFDAGVTGLSLLAFLGAGYSHLSKDVFDGIRFGDVVRKAQQRLMAIQDPEGCIGSRNHPKYMYNHAICALALNEAFGLTGSAMLKDAAQRGTDFLVAAQNPGRGWRYSYKCGDNDTSVTGWGAMALKSAELSGIPFPRTAYDGARAWFDEATEATYDRVGYTQKGTGKVFIPGKNEHFDHHETLTAIAVMARIFIDKQPNDPRLKNGAALLLRDKAVYEGNAIDFYYWYSAALALFQHEGPKSENWKAWRDPLMNALVKHQNLDSSGCRGGSWEPNDRWSCEGGRVYATAINALTLEVFYRYTCVFGSDKR